MTISRATEIFLNNIDLIGFDLVQMLVKELEGQGHRATGKLINSVVHEVNNRLNEAIIEIKHVKYGIFQETGIAASRIPYNPNRRSGKRVSQFIQALAQWVKFKGIAGGLDKNIMSATFAIANSMKKQGMPTRGSFAYSKNGRRTGWISHVQKTYGKQIELRAELAVSQLYSNALDAKIIELERKYSTIQLIAA
jgi:hypothetical protein